MSENYIVINGKKAELTEEQLKALGIEVEEKRKNPFERVMVGEDYYIIDIVDNVSNSEEREDRFDNVRFDHVNYFNDKAFAKQVALHQLLYRKLLKFAWEHDLIRLTEDIDICDSKTVPWVVQYYLEPKCFTSSPTIIPSPIDVLFKTEDAADAAIEEVVKPFVKEHPDFVW